MKLDEIKRLVTHCSQEELRAAEQALMDGNTPVIEVHGADEGEQLTHILSAIWVHEQMEEKNLNISMAMRELTRKVRDSIS